MGKNSFYKTHHMKNAAAAIDLKHLFTSETKQFLAGAISHKRT